MYDIDKDFAEEIQLLQSIYEQLDEENKSKLFEAIVVVNTKFKKRIK